jgi:hypothetical protein
LSCRIVHCDMMCLRNIESVASIYLFKQYFSSLVIILYIMKTKDSDLILLL